MAHLKILHLSHDSLPDWRVEKAAISALKNSHEVAFAGKYQNGSDKKTFSKIYNVVWTAKARFGIPFYWHSVKKQLESIIRQARPDIVHAHNIFSAKMISEFDIPFVYDDHEYWPLQARLLKEIANQPTLGEQETTHSVFDLPKRIRRKFINSYAIHLWTNWEKEVVSSAPTITVSDKLAEGIRVTGNSNKVFIVPNFPMTFETENLKQPYIQSMLSSVYAGSDGLNKQKIPNRNIDGITEIFVNKNIGRLTIIGWEGSPSDKITYSGLLSRQSMFLEMLKHSIGLIPFKKHWSHVFVNPNKAYEYAHAGLFVMCTASLKSIKETLKDNCMMFEDYDELVSHLEYLRDHMEELYAKRIKTFEFARSNLVWEKYENNIFRAYQLC
jgi:hypothetical protein